MESRSLALVLHRSEYRSISRRTAITGKDARATKGARPNSGQDGRFLFNCAQRNFHMIRLLMCTFLAVTLVASASLRAEESAAPVLTVQTDKPGVRISPSL